MHKSNIFRFTDKKLHEAEFQWRKVIVIYSLGQQPFTECCLCLHSMKDTENCNTNKPKISKSSEHKQTWLTCFHMLALISSDSVNMCLQISFQDTNFNYFGYIQRSGIARS